MEKFHPGEMAKPVIPDWIPTRRENPDVDDPMRKPDPINIPTEEPVTVPREPVPAGR